MAIASPKTAADRFLHALTGCVPNLCGDVTLEPSNYILDWRLDDINDENEPLSFSLGKPEEQDGFWVYISEPNGSPSSLAAHNTNPISLDEDVYYLKSPYVAGHAPRDPRFAARISAPDTADLTTRAASTDGFAPGTYQLAYTWINGDKHTAISPVISLTVGLGQYIRVTLPTGPPEGTDYVGIWSTSPNGGLDTLRLQEVVWAGINYPETRLLRGPFRTRTPSSTRNETYIAPPRAPTLARVKREGGLSKPGTYKGRITRFDPRTGKESAPSGYSNEIVLTQAEADKGIGVGLDVEITGNYYVYITLDGVEYRLTTDRSGGQLGSRRPHSSSRTTRGGRRTRINRMGCERLRHVTTGLTASERGSSQEPTRVDLVPARPPKAAPTYRTRQPSSITNFEYDDEFQIEDPTSPLDGAVPEGAVRITPATYWVALSFSVRGEETVISPPTQLTISSGQVGLVKLPDSNNVITNAQWADRDANGLADTWEFSGVAGGSSGGTVYYAEDGSLVLDTLGSKTGTTATPATWQEIFISRNQFYAIGGKISAILVSGSVTVQLREFSRDSSSSLRTTTLITFSSTGSNVSFNKVFGAGYTDFHSDTDYIEIRALFSGSTREGRLYLHELYANPGSSKRLRRTTSPLPQSREFTNSSPPTNTRWNKESIVGVMLPPAATASATSALPLVVQDFESSDMQGFTLRQSSSTGTTALREGAAAIAGSFGYTIAKTTGSTRYTYLHQDMGAARKNLAINFRVRVSTLPSRGTLYLGGIKNLLSDGTGPTSSSGYLTGVGLSSRGALYLGYRRGGDQYVEGITGVKSGDVLDIEFKLINANSSSARAVLYVGKNGARRSLVAQTSSLDYSGFFARYAYIGHFAATDPGATYSLRYDDVVLTDTGNIGGADFSAPPEGFAYELPDRAYQDPVVIQDASFDTGALPTGITSSRTPTDSTTAVAVETGAKIDGTHGVRCADTGTATVASAYITRSFSPTRTSVGIRSRIRVVIRPGTGTIDLMDIRSSGGQVLGRIRLDNIGDLYAQTLTSAGVQHKQTRLARNVTTGTVLTLEMVPNGVGTASGTLSYWISVGGTGNIAERSMLAQHILAPWLGLNISNVRVGIVTESTAAATSTLNVDSVRVTEAGEILFAEEDEEGNSVYQMYFYYPAGTLQSDDLGPGDYSCAVQPNETYTFAVEGRHADVPADLPAYPFSFYAYDTAGTEYPLGSVYGAGGATGTSSWQDLSLSFTVPDDCYIITMSSPGISSGEFVYQRPVLSRGTEATREVFYPENGEVWAILDTETPESFAFLPEDGNPLDNRWLDIGAVIDAPAGTSYAAQYNSADPVVDASGELMFTGTEQPTSWLTNPLSVTPRRYAHFLLQLNSSSDRRSTPTLRTDTPYVDYYTRMTAEQISVLLRDDLSEFSGGVHILSDIGFFRDLSAFDVRQPLGMVRRQRMYEPVGDLGGFTMRAYTREAIRDIEENCESLDFAVETRDYRLIVRFRGPIEFGSFTDTRKIRGVWCTVAEASVDGVEVVEAIPINALVESLVAP